MFYLKVEIIYSIITIYNFFEVIALKIKDSFLLKDVAGKVIVVPTGKATLDFNAIITLNETGAFLFKKMQERDMTEAELVDALLAEYDVPREIAEADVANFVANILGSGITE